VNAFNLEMLIGSGGRLSDGGHPSTLAMYAAKKRNRMCFALGMRDQRNDSYDGESYVNCGYESDCYWAGRMLAGQLRRDYSMWVALAEVQFMAA
jgi:hypothetical protein